MLDKTMVQRIAFENNLFELVTAIEEDYAEVLKNYGVFIKQIKESDIPEIKEVGVTWHLL